MKSRTIINSVKISRDSTEVKAGVDFTSDNQSLLVVGYDGLLDPPENSVDSIPRTFTSGSVLPTRSIQQGRSFTLNFIMTSRKIKNNILQIQGDDLGLQLPGEKAGLIYIFNELQKFLFGLNSDTNELNLAIELFSIPFRSELEKEHINTNNLSNDYPNAEIFLQNWKVIVTNISVNNEFTLVDGDNAKQGIEFSVDFIASTPYPLD